MELNEDLKNARIKKKLSIRKLSELSGVNASYISRLERGVDKNPGIEILLKLCKFLDIDISKFVSYATEEERNIHSLKEITNLINENPQYKEKILDTLNSMYNILIGEFYKPSSLKNSDVVIKTLNNNLELYRELMWELHNLSNESFVVSDKLIKNKDFYKLYNLKDEKTKRVNNILNELFNNYLIRYGLIDEEPKEIISRFIRNPNLP
ncbi:helix-turn-helix domain-containing protein [Clostridium sp.]|jgi:transcriptional regulator with XRE-family HTH domain|uniref:helix-turn-helix domain-containing protein n=1 Tax=Clostridium sp. TaxID=1506 RepID=UPI002FDE0626